MATNKTAQGGKGRDSKGNAPKVDSSKLPKSGEVAVSRKDAERLRQEQGAAVYERDGKIYVTKDPKMFAKNKENLVDPSGRKVQGWVDAKGNVLKAKDRTSGDMAPVYGRAPKDKESAKTYYTEHAFATGLANANKDPNDLVKGSFIALGKDSKFRNDGRLIKVRDLDNGTALYQKVDKASTGVIGAVGKLIGDDRLAQKVPGWVYDVMDVAGRGVGAEIAGGDIGAQKQNKWVDTISRAGTKIAAAVVGSTGGPAGAAAGTAIANLGMAGITDAFTNRQKTDWMDVAKQTAVESAVAYAGTGIANKLQGNAWNTRLGAPASPATPPQTASANLDEVVAQQTGEMGNLDDIVGQQTGTFAPSDYSSAMDPSNLDNVVGQQAGVASPGSAADEARIRQMLGASGVPDADLPASITGETGASSLKGSDTGVAAPPPGTKSDFGGIDWDAEMAKVTDPETRMQLAIARRQSDIAAEQYAIAKNPQKDYRWLVDLSVGAATLLGNIYLANKNQKETDALAREHDEAIAEAYERQRESQIEISERYMEELSGGGGFAGLNTSAIL